MAQLLEIVEGWTGRLGPFVARADGVGVNLTGMTVTAMLRGRGQTTYMDTVGDVVLDNQTTNPGGWFFDPDAADFLQAESPYSLRLRVVDGAAKTVFFANAVQPDTVGVGKP